MKLINPTDEELNAAFAEKVAGWGLLVPSGFDGKDHIGIPPKGQRTGNAEIVPRFTTSADAVLPWLDQMNYIATCCPVSGSKHHHCIITIHTWHTAEKIGDANSQCFARAAVIALLRAHGVEVEFLP